MADELNGWLDEAAADRLLRGEPVEPVGQAADRRARIEAARLRAALDALAPSAGLASAGAELPGEAAALAAFRAARATTGTPVGTPAAVSGEPLIDLGRIVPADAHAHAPAAASVRALAPRRRRTVSFGLAAALASVAVGGLAAAAGAGLLERSRHDSAGPGPALSVSAEENPAPGTGTGAPTPGPKLRSTPLPDGSHATATPGATQPPGADGRTTQGSGNGAGTSSGTAATGGGSGKDARDGQSGAGGAGGTQDTFTGDLAKDREAQNRLTVDLCKDFRSGVINDDRRERLSRLADGIARIPKYCETVLDGDSGAKRGDAPQQDGRLRAPSRLTPAVPQGSTGLLTSR
ncbi:hypothetical protein [Streptomyces sp. NPDC054797]